MLKRSAAARKPAEEPVEACPTCGAQFATIAALIAHAEAAHAPPPAHGSPSLRVGPALAAAAAACPRCGAQPGSAEALRQHIATAHGVGGGGGGGGDRCVLS
jgi:uncharacterized C2H2 Zn-finger protein